MSLGSLVVELSANLARFESDMGRAARIAERHMADMDRFMGRASLIFQGVAAGGLAIYIKGLVDAAEHMNKMAQRTGYSVGALSELKFAADLGDVEFTAFAKSLEFFSVKMVEASNPASKAARIFKELGVDISKGPNVALMQFAERTAGITDASVKTTLFKEMLSKMGPALIPVFQNLKETTDQARRMGVTMSDETAKAAERLNDNLKALKIQTDAFTTKKMDGIVGAFATITDNIVKASEKGEKWLQILKEIAKVNLAFGANMLEGAPGMLGLAGGIMSRTAEGMFAGKNGLRPGEVSGKIGGLPQTITPPPDSGALTRILAENDAKAEALKKRQLAAQQQLEEKAAALNGQTEQQLILQRLLTGSYKDFEPAMRPVLLNLAAEIDFRKQTIDRLDAQYDAMAKVLVANEEADAAQREFTKAQNDAIKDQQFQNELIGKTAYEQQKLTAMRQIDLAAIQAASKLDAETQGKQIEAIYKQAEITKSVLLPILEERRKKERDWQTGAKSALDSYADHAMNAAEHASMFWTNAFQNMEDALVKFVQTGKLDFKSLANSIIADLIRIQIRQQILGPLAKVLGASSMFSWSQTAAPVVERSFNASYAEGTRYVPRTGPAILHEGERVLTASENARGSGASIVFSPQINIDSRTDSATIGRMVDGAMRVSEARLIDQLNRSQGGISQAVRRAA